MKKKLLILILSLAALSGEAQVEDFDSVSYAIGDSYTRVYLSAETSNLNWEWNDTSAVDFLKAIDDHIHYLNYLQDSINSPSFSIGLMQGVFFLDSYEHYKEKDGIILECIIDGMSKVANNDLILPQDTIAIQEYMLSLPDDMNPSELPQEERCKFFSYYGTMKGLQPGLQDYIYEITGKSKNEIPANQKAYATGFLLMLIRMEAQENISSSYELGKIMITDVIFELIRYNSISSKFNLESFKLGCRAAMGLAERKLSISQCDSIYLSIGNINSDNDYDYRYHEGDPIIEEKVDEPQ